MCQPDKHKTFAVAIAPRPLHESKAMTEAFALLVVVPCAYAMAAAIVSVLFTIVSALFTKAKS